MSTPTMSMFTWTRARLKASRYIYSLIMGATFYLDRCRFPLQIHAETNIINKTNRIIF